jgi:predicted nucleic acid-binding protein
MRVVFDTNVFVLYFLGDPAESIVKAALAPPESRPLSFFYSAAILEEYETVFSE